MGRAGVAGKYAVCCIGSRNTMPIGEVPIFNQGGAPCPTLFCFTLPWLSLPSTSFVILNGL